MLDRVRAAEAGQKHYILRNMSILLGGVLDQGKVNDKTAIRWLLDALPAGVADSGNAEKTASWGLQIGRGMPLDLPPPD